MKCSSMVETWGSTPHERQAHYPCDDLIDSRDALFRAVDINAPSGMVFRWILQLRLAPYSYDLLDNRGSPSPRHLSDGLEHLEVGQSFMRIFRLASFEDGHSITLDSTTALFGRVVVTYKVVPVGDEHSRLVVKLILSEPPGLRGWVMRRLLPPGDLFMMRKQLLTLKALAERDTRQKVR